MIGCGGRGGFCVALFCARCLMSGSGVGVGVGHDWVWG